MALAPHIERSRLPESLVAEIRDAYRELQSRARSDLVVAVRSSARSEDASTASSAGLYETYLNLRDEAAVLDGVLRCYRSLWSHRAVQYRAFKRIDSAREAMAVVVMEMVPSEVSGVAFTVNALTGDRDQITVNASWGLGEAIVSGRVTPDQFILQKPSLTVLSRAIYPKEIQISPDPSGASGTVQQDVPPARATAPALDDAQLHALGELCLRIETQYGRPMDIEWAFARGELYVLQARPVTGIGEGSGPRS
jgi:pyruvate,water dikinase